MKYYVPTLADKLSYLSDELQVVLWSRTSKALLTLTGPCTNASPPGPSSSLCIPDSLFKLHCQSGFPPHIDSVADFKDYPGMVFKIALASPFTPDGRKKYKYFNYINLFNESHHSIVTQIHSMQLEQGDVSVTSCQASYNWAPGVPEQEFTQFTLGIKTC